MGCAEGSDFGRCEEVIEREINGDRTQKETSTINRRTIRSQIVTGDTTVTKNQKVKQGRRDSIDKGKRRSAPHARGKGEGCSNAAEPAQELEKKPAT